MKLLISSIAIVFSFLVFHPAHSQVTGNYEYAREFVWGITKATNSGLIGGFILKFSRIHKERVYHGLEIDVVNIKHPLEHKIYSPYGNPYIHGKSYYLYNFRFNYSRDYILFGKAPQQGVQIAIVTQAGLNLGLEAPYYVEVQADGTTKRVHYTPNSNIDNIVGTGTLFQGVGESNIVPGLNLKLAASFEFGAFKSNVVGLEVGFIGDFFSREIRLMPTTYNKQIFPASFITLFYGSRK